MVAFLYVAALHRTPGDAVRGFLLARIAQVGFESLVKGFAVDVLRVLGKVAAYRGRQLEVVAVWHRFRPKGKEGNAYDDRERSSPAFGSAEALCERKQESVSFHGLPAVPPIVSVGFCIFFGVGPRSPAPRFSRAVISATCLPWKRAPASSFSLGCREPSGPASVVAP